MQGPEPIRAAQRSDTTGSRSPAEPAAGPVAGAHDPRTIRSGSSASGSPWRRAAAAGTLPGPGDRIDFFELQEAIGSGGMGAVFRALDTRLDRPVALKILPPDQDHDAEIVQRFYQEGRAAARLDHENIARVFTIGHDRAFHYIAFEFIEGTTIRQRVERRGPLPVAEADQLHPPDRRRAGARLGTRRRAPRHQARRTSSSRRRAAPSWWTWAWRGGSSAAARTTA
jgi:serine/threonine-protein kinase